MDFAQLSILVVVAAVFGIIAKTLRQPLLVGYLFAGFVLAAFGLINESAALESLGKIGVTFLLFLLGLEMNLKELPSIGKVALLTGFGQIIVTFIFGVILVSILGIGFPAAFYVAIALAFSSTVIIVKLLSEKKDLNSLYGKISIGFLLVQDFVAIVILIFLSSVGKGNLGIEQYGLIALKIILLFIAVWSLSKKILPYIFDKVASGSTELLFITSIAWALGFASFVAGPVGFTLEIGGLLAGIALSSLPEHLHIASRVRPLRDFFLTIFFLYLGTKLYIGGEILSLLPRALVLSAFVLVVKPVIVFIIMGLLGYKKRTSFMAGFTVAQISEFSIIIMAVGESLNYVDKSHASLIILAGVITMTVSTYLILGSDKIFKKIRNYLTVFEKKKTKELALVGETKMKDHVVLVGVDRTGKTLLNYFKSRSIPFLAVDFNPAIFRVLTAQNIPLVFGDISDPEILEYTNLDEAKMVISTIPNIDDNLFILEHIRSMDKKPKSIMVSQTKQGGIKLYEAGASYVIIPEVVAGEHIRHIISHYGIEGGRLSKHGKKHFDRLIFS